MFEDLHEGILLEFTEHRAGELERVGFDGTHVVQGLDCCSRCGDPCDGPYCSEWCKRGKVTANREQYEKRAESVKAASRARYEQNRDQVLATQREYYARNREKILAATRERMKLKREARRAAKAA
jgi:hypothetical protein